MAFGVACVVIAMTVLLLLITAVVAETWGWTDGLKYGETIGRARLQSEQAMYPLPARRPSHSEVFETRLRAEKAEAQLTQAVRKAAHDQAAADKERQMMADRIKYLEDRHGRLFVWLYGYVTRCRVQGAPCALAKPCHNCEFCDAQELLVAR